MVRSIAGGLFGALAGLGIGILAWTGLAFFGLDLPKAGAFAFHVAGLAFGGWVGFHRGPIARWVGSMAALVGAVGFAGGFLGPLLLNRDSPQGPLLGIFVTGPYGAIVGAMIGLVMGVLRERWVAARPAG